MGMEFTDHVTDRARRFLMLGAGFQAKFTHCINNAPLHRFQAISYMWQGAVEDHVHGVVKISFLGILPQCYVFNMFQAYGHVYSDPVWFLLKTGFWRGGGDVAVLHSCTSPARTSHVG